MEQLYKDFEQSNKDMLNYYLYLLGKANSKALEEQQDGKIITLTSAKTGEVMYQRKKTDWRFTNDYE